MELELELLYDEKRDKIKAYGENYCLGIWIRSESLGFTGIEKHP
jgi:hypothetical protein